MARRERRYAGMTKTDREFAKALVQTGSVRQAATIAGVSDSTGYRLRSKPVILQFFANALAEAGIDDKAIVKVIKEAMEANKTVLLPDGKGGVVKEYEPDHRTRLAAVDQMTETALKLRAIEKGHAEDQLAAGIPANFTELGDDDLTKLLARRAGR